MENPRRSQTVERYAASLLALADKYLPKVVRVYIQSHPIHQATQTQLEQTQQQSGKYEQELVAQKELNADLISQNAAYNQQVLNLNSQLAVTGSRLAQQAKEVSALETRVMQLQELQLPPLTEQERARAQRDLEDPNVSRGYLLGLIAKGSRAVKEAVKSILGKANEA